MGDHETGPEYKAFVGGISWQMDDQSLLKEFENHGAHKAEIMMDKMTNRSRGFGFVYFNSRAGMEDAIKDKHNSEIDGRRISVKEAIPQDQIPPEQRGRDKYRAGGYQARYPDRYDSRGYDSRGGYGSYDSRGYGGYDSRSYGSYGGDYYRDPYYGSGYGAYDSRGGYGGYDSRSGGYGGGYDSRSYGGHSGGYGPDRGASRGYGSSAPRSGPYERR